MDISTIQDLWQQHETLLDSHRKLNTALLKEIKLDKAKSSLRNLLFLPVSSLVFFLSTASYGIYFTATQGNSWYFAFAGIIVVVFSFLFTGAAVRQLRQILSVDFDEPVVRLQKDLSRIKSSVITNFRMASWLLPFAPFLSFFFVKILFGFDWAATLTGTGIVIMCSISLLLLTGAVLLSSAFSARNRNKKWMRWLMQGSGSQVDEALAFLDQITEFEK
ncbi:MAG: hypothetical protein JXR71_07915 [Bacteroidales bacterium]|nr:hypothetical protein [Bacteroidales bacterium]